MQSSIASDRVVRVGHALFAGAALIYVVLVGLCFFFIDEDSYIYFRAAENIAAGHGYVFNRGGPPVETGSGPIWQGLLALGMGLGVHEVHLVKVLGCSFGLATLWNLYCAGRRHASPVIAALPCLLLASSVPFVWWSGSGLEVAAHTALLTWCVRLASDPGDSGWRRALPFMCLPLVRPEGMLYVLCFLGYFGLTGARRLAVRLAVIVGASYFAYLVFRYAYFHELQISAFYAKVARTGFAWEYPRYVFDQLGLFYLLALVVPALWVLRSARSQALVSLLWVLSVAGLYFAVANRDFKVYYRFFALCLPQVFLLCTLSTELLLARLRGHSRVLLIAYTMGACAVALWRPALAAHWDIKDDRLTDDNPFRVAMRLAAEDPVRAAAAYGAQWRNPHGSSHYGARLQALVPFVLRENYHAAIGGFLRDNYLEGSVIAYDQMGQTPYFAGQKHRFLDFLGLVSRPISLYMFTQATDRSFAARAYRTVVDPLVRLVEPNENRRPRLHDAMAWLRAQRPDVVLIHGKLAHAPEFFTYHVRRSPWLRDNYVPHYVLAKWVTVFERVDRQFPLRVHDPAAILELRVLRTDGSMPAAVSTGE